MKSNPNCKINLGLRVLRKRPDGYHDLATVFLPVPLCDQLDIVEAPRFEMTQSGILVDCSLDDNICVKAYRLLKEEFPSLPPVHIHLQKNIPFGAGLGGGSSDAAFTLRMLNELFALGLTPEALRLRAARLGADCPFFIDNIPAYATGIGDRLTPLGFNPIEGYDLKIQKPDDAVSTREAYAGIRLPDLDAVADYDVPVTSPLLRALRQPIATWRDTIVNDFEATVLPQHPAIAALKARFYADGALYASMTGSGAAVFALFPMAE